MSLDRRFSEGNVSPTLESFFPRELTRSNVSEGTLPSIREERECHLCGKIDNQPAITGAYLQKKIDSYKISFIPIGITRQYHLRCLHKTYPTFGAEFIGKGKLTPEREQMRKIMVSERNMNYQNGNNGSLVSNGSLDSVARILGPRTIGLGNPDPVSRIMVPGGNPESAGRLINPEGLNMSLSLKNLSAREESGLTRSSSTNSPGSDSYRARGNKTSFI
ncbi:MAG: hypothetical protein ACRCU2_11845, partial [Planktothrix sp.]